MLFLQVRDSSDFNILQEIVISGIPSRHGFHRPTQGIAMPVNSIPPPRQELHILQGRGIYVSAGAQEPMHFTETC